MYSVSADFLTAMAAPVQQHKVKGTIGSASFGPVNILAGSFSINNKICDSNEIGIGNVYIGELTATFRGVAISDGNWNGQVITPVFSLLVDEDTDTWEDVPLGVFTVAEATISASGVTVKAYDNMTKFDQYCTTYHGSGGGPQMAEGGSMVQGRIPFGALGMICRKVGVTFGMRMADVAALPNGTNPLNLFEDNDITTYRDMLSWIAQTLACNATINRAGELVLVPFKSASDYTFDDEHRHEGATFKDFTTRITQIWLDCKPVETSYEYHVSPNNGLSYELGQNPYLQIGSSADRDTAMNAILTSLQNVNYTPFDVNLTGCPIFDLGDVLTFTDGILSTSKKGAVTSFTYTANAAYKLSCGGKNPAEANAKSATDKRIDGVSSSVSSQKSNVTSIRNGEAATLGTGVVVDVIEYPYEVTDTQNHTNISAEVIMTTSAVETLAGDVYTLGDISVKAIFYVDGIEIGDLYPEFIVDEGKDTINIDYSLHNLSVGAHKFKIALQLFDATGSISAQDIHEMLWGYGITFEVYLKSIEVVSGRNVFRINEALDTSDWHVRGINNNGTYIPTLTGWTTDPADGYSWDEAGEETVEVDYNGISCEYPIEIVYAPYDGCKVYYYDQYLELWDENGNKEGVRYINNADLYGNDHEMISQSSGDICYEGRDIRTSSSPSNSPLLIQGAPDGYVYMTDIDGDSCFCRVRGNSIDGDISEEEIGTLSVRETTAFVCDGIFTGDIIPFIEDTSGYGYIDLKTNSIVRGFGSLASGINVWGWGTASLRLENGDSYFFVGCGIPKYMHAYVGGVHHWYDLSSIDSLDAGSGYFSYGLYHDKTLNNLVLYICRCSGTSPFSGWVNTHAYKLSMDGHSVISSVSLPSYLDVPVDPNATDIAYYEQATTFRVWMNGSNLTTYFPSTVDGVRLNTFDMMLHFSNVSSSGYLSKPRNYVDFSGYDKMPADRQYLIGTTYTASVHNYVQRCVYIDNLYMQDSAGNVVKEW